MKHQTQNKRLISVFFRWTHVCDMLDAPLSSTLRVLSLKKESKQTTQTRDRGGGQGPHLHEQDFGRTIRGTGGALLLLTRDTTGSQRGARWTPNSTGGLISVLRPASSFSLAVSHYHRHTGTGVAGAAAGVTHITMRASLEVRPVSCPRRP